MEIQQKLQQKRQILRIFRQIQDQFEAFLFEIADLLTKAHKNKNFPLVEGFYRSSQQSLSIVSQKLNKIGENREIFEILSFSMSIPDNFHLQNCIYLSTKHTGYPIHSLWT